MKFISLLRFAVSCFFIPVCYGQTTQIIVPLTTTVGYGPSEPGVNPTNIYGPESFNFDTSRTFKGIPADLSTTMIKELDFQPAQGIYELYKRMGGKMSPQMLLKGLDGYKTDTLALSSVPIKHTVHILCGITATGKRVIITDTNNNFDFSDEKPQTYDTARLRMSIKDAEQGVPNQVVQYQFAYRGKVYKRKVNLRMSPYPTAFRYRNPAEQDLYLVTFMNEYQQGKVVVDGKTYLLSVCYAYQPPFMYDSLNTRIFITTPGKNNSTMNRLPVSYNIGDTLYVNPGKYNLAAVDPAGTRLLLTYAGKGETITGSESGQYAYNIDYKDINGKDFNLSALKGKYVLLDFWGSWCKPCISAIPELVNLHERFKDSLSIISIAYDNKDNLSTIRKIIVENKMEWTHLFEDMRAKENIVNHFKVETFPTQLLINPNGKIILRIEGTGKGGLIKDSILSPVK